MLDSSRHQDLTARVNAARDVAERVFAKLTDAMKENYGPRGFYPLDDAERCLAKRPSAIHENLWLDGASLFLHLAERELQRLIDGVARCGGPEKVEAIG